MTHEKIYKRADGSKVRIYVSLWVAASNQRHDLDAQCNLFRYDVFIGLIPSDKRKELHENQIGNAVAFGSEIDQVKLELWNKLKPAPTLNVPERNLCICIHRGFYENREINKNICDGCGKPIN